jgi:chemotaxis signal transduction protein
VNPGEPLNPGETVNSDEHVERVLAERARLLARPLAEPNLATADEMLVLEAGGERYAVELAAVERVHPVETVTSVPGLGAPWAGLVSLRGEILPALDLPAYLGRPPSPPDAARAPAASCAVVAAGGLRVALLSDVPVALRSRPGGGLAAPFPEGNTAPAGAIVGVTDDLVTILDVPTILADPALVVDHDVNRT